MILDIELLKGTDLNCVDRNASQFSCIVILIELDQQQRKIIFNMETSRNVDLLVLP